MLRSRRFLAGLSVVLVVLATTTPAGAQSGPTEPVDPGAVEPAGEQPTPDGEPIVGDKSTTASIAETDPSLLGRSDGETVPVLIKLDYDAIAAYAGGRAGLAATSPSETGEPLTTVDITTGPYARQVARDEAAIVGDIRAAVPSIEIGQSLRIVYGGVAARVPANQVDALLAVDGVVAVQSDAPEQLLTDSTPSFVGADQVWSQVGGQATAGSGVIFGTLDTGVWPEHPQLADTGVLSTPPAKADGTPRDCDFGDNPLTPATDVFNCNDKLIGGNAFTATYNAQFGDDMYESSTRDSDGHGTHTTTTAAGIPVADANPLGISRGPISGLAPGAWVSAYKVCGPQGCFPSDSAAAVQQAILDGVRVINFSISGGSNPATDPVELAFLDAYAAGVFVAASAGNSGPGADTADHNGPWTTTVAATSPNRDWATTLNLTGGAGLAIPGLSITSGISTPLPIVAASAPPYNNAQCTTPAPAGIFTGKIVACERSAGRVLKGFNVKQGGAAGMVLYNATPFNVSAENHWLPTVHIQDGPALVAHLTANPGATASFAQGAAAPATGDEMAAFSSRGPGGLTIKPDVGAPGQQVLAGHTPTPADPSGGPPGEYYRVIDGTSMAAPHVAGSALLLFDAHPSWTPGNVRSALTGSATPDVTGGGSPADPFDTGSGRIQVDAAVSPGLLLDETASRFGALGTDPANAVHLNLAQVDAPQMPGRLRTTRTVTNPGAAATYTAATSVGAGSTITVEPSTFTLGTGESQVLEITIDTEAAIGTQVFGSITLTAGGRSDTRLPVAFVPQPSEIAITATGCTPDPIEVPQTSTCSYEIANEGGTDGLVDLRAEGDASATVIGASLGAAASGGVASVDDVELDGYAPGVPHTAPGSSPAGYLPLDVFGVTPAPIGDEQFLNFNVPSFVWGDRTYTRVGVNSNGFLRVGGGDSPDDNECCDLTAIGDPARPNDVLAPFWTDLDGTGAPGIYAEILTDGVSEWLVFEWRVNVFGTNSQRVFQTWIGLNGAEDISFAYDPAHLPASPGAGFTLLVGAENRDGAGTTTLATNTVPTEDLRVTTGAITPSGIVEWDVTVQGTAEGTADIEADATSNAHPGTVVAVNQLEVDPEPLPVVTDDPDDLTVDALATATFTAAATGGTLARWERLPDGSATWETVSGATSTTLSFTAHVADDGNQYRAVFANTSGGEVTTDAATLTVDALDTVTTVSVSPTNPSRGQDVTLTANVVPGTASGTVQFAIDGTDEGSPVTLSAGTASLVLSDLAAGDHTVTATYSGDADHLTSTDSADVTVTRNTSSTTIVEITSGVIGEDTPIDATITVTPVPTGGTVELTVDGTPYGSPLTLDGSGSVETTLTGLDPGSRTIVAEFTGDDDLDPSQDEVTITVYEAEEAFVRRAYQVMLGRNGDATGIAYWVGRIEGGMDRTMLIDRFAASL
ncbi:MAG TPA: S8 family serine peptidase, partial [Iamia sp.]